MNIVPSVENFYDPKIRQYIYYQCNKKLTFDEIMFLLYYNDDPIPNADIILENHMQPEKSFSERWENAKILVIGANYRPSERERWEQIDPNYIGFGFAFAGDEMQFVDGNPLEENWDIVEFNILFDLMKKKKFDAIYVDRGVYQHLTDIMKLQLNNNKIFRQTPLIVPISIENKFDKWKKIDEFVLWDDSELFTFVKLERPS